MFPKIKNFYKKTTWLDYLFGWVEPKKEENKIERDMKYTDSEILERVKSVGGKIKPKGTYLLVGVQSKKDSYNVFDDKFYVFDGDEFVMVTTGTTNAGATALKNFEKYNPKGTAVWKTDRYYDGLYTPGLHRGKMKALRQSKPIFYYRDRNKDNKADESGPLYNEIIYANNHGVDYDPFSKKIGNQINGWSAGCQVMNNMTDYRNWIKAAWKRNKPVDYCLLKEW